VRPVAGEPHRDGVTVSPGATLAPGTRARLPRVETVMGTTVGVDVRDRISDEALAPLLDAFFAVLADIDRRFSPYRADSEVSRISRGELAEEDASPDLRWILGACEDLRRISGGTFDARGHRPDGGLDPSGIVKGWAIEEAAAVLEAAGLRDYAINAGGDVLAVGGPEPVVGPRDRASGALPPWRVGIQHPLDPGAIAAVLLVRDRAVATSGQYQRPGHLRDPRGGAVDGELLSLTVVGPSLTWADAYATAAYPMGLAGLGWVHDRLGYGALAIGTDLQVTWTPSVEPLLER
jgi:thiamine biosynthesis lipoprotein